MREPFDAMRDPGLGEAPVADVSERAPAPPWRRVSTWFGIYGVVLALIAFWPQPVDSGAGQLLRWIGKVLPVLTYQRIEFGANILLFVPFGIGLALLFRSQRYLVVPLALLVSLAIESVQAVLIPDRTPSLYDILANVAGACAGLVAVVFVEASRGRGGASPR